MRSQTISYAAPDILLSQERLFDSVSIVLVGKYTALKDSYMSVIKSLEHSAFRCRRKLILQMVPSEDLEQSTLESAPVRYHDAWRALVGAQGVLVPGGFGTRGTEGMVLAVKWAREQNVPFFGICLGFQIAVVEWARNVLGHKDANSTELDENTTHPAIVFMPEISTTHKGGTMRLGLRPTIFEEGTETWSKVRRMYAGAPKIWERHRHRWEVNPQMVEELDKSGLKFIGRDEKGERMQVLELPGASCSLRVCYIAEADSICRPPILRRSSGAPRVLHSSSRPFPSVPRLRCCSLWLRCSSGAGGVPRAELPPTAS